ncbi:MAG TPA: helix-turn-helix transcriptional regulator, partial [Polyangiaceae bacterium]|nr:helix-turn-helix transcriptional regulator [Polyangiaceae bacterium]
SPPVSERLPLADLWAGVRAGTHFVQEGYYSEERCFLGIELRPTPSPRRKPLRMDVFERILSGEGYKRVAFEDKLAVSTISVLCGDCLDAIGAARTTSRVPLLLLMAVHAHRGVSLPPARMYRWRNDGKEQWVVTAERPDRTLPRDLTGSEASVVRSLVEGLSHQQIGELRSTSRRTVANQLAQAFRKLGVSGRTELIAMLVRRGASVTLSPPLEAEMPSLSGPAPW